MTDTGPVDSLSLVGTTIAEKYAIESVVGLGGFATVYRANHLLWKRPVAVKVFTALGQVRAEDRKKLLDEFIQEGALLAELSERSTAICQARDVGMLTTASGETAPYMVLEWLEGKSLETVLDEERAAGATPRTLDEAIRLLGPVAEALALAHKKNIAHRDVKPANVFVLGDPHSRDANVKLLDFGIAKVVQDAQKMGFAKTAGHVTSFTPFYGAPEQFDRGHGATGPWTDVFALALVVAEVISGKEPMSGDSLVQLAVASSDPNRRPTPRALGVELGAEVEAVFAKAVAVKPEARWQTCAAFWSALERAATGSVRTGNLIDTGPVSSAATMMASPASTSMRASGSENENEAEGNNGKKSKAPLVVGLVVLGVLVAGGAVLFGRSGGSGYKGGVMSAEPNPSAGGAAGAAASAFVPGSASAPASSSAAAAGKKACPAGMLYIPGGSFFMGSDEKDAFDFEKPPHQVKLAPYCLDELEATVAKYKECSDGGKCRRAGKENVWPGIKPAQQKIYDPLCNINDAVAKAQHPINCVDWQQAREFCEAEGRRLPTEAEWEFAARGSDGRIYPWGDDAPNAHLLNACGKECVAWMKKHPDPENPAAAMYDEDDGFATTAPVGSFPKGKSRWGVQDLVGNVWEWVADYYADYDKAAAGAIAVDPKGPAVGTDRVIRGGGWNGAMPSWVHPSFRYHAAEAARSHGFGIRCAKTP